VLAAGQRAAEAPDRDEQREGRRDAIEGRVGRDAAATREERERAAESEERTVRHHPERTWGLAAPAGEGIPEHGERVVNAERPEHRERQGTHVRLTKAGRGVAVRAQEEPRGEREGRSVREEPGREGHGVARLQSVDR
jgi:hypothetical protein